MAFLPKFSGKFEVLKITSENRFKLRSVDNPNFITYQNKRLLNRCPDAGQPNPMQKRFRKWHFECLCQAELWKARLAAQRAELDTAGSPETSKSEDKPVEKKKFEKRPHKSLEKRKENDEKHLHDENLEKNKRKHEPYNLRNRKKIDYREKDRRKLNLLEENVKKVKEKIKVI